MINTENEKIIREIAALLDSFSIHIYNLHQSGSAVTKLDADLLKDKLLKIYDNVNSLDDGRPSAISIQNGEPVIMQPVNYVFEERNSDELPGIFEIDPVDDEIKETKDEVRPAENDKAPAPPPPSVKPENGKKGKPELPKANDDETIGGRYNAGETLYDKISQGDYPQGIGEQMQNTPLEDLRRSIGLNERFAFIRGLFDNNQQAFYNCIDQLNALQNYAEAHSFFESQAEANNWNRNNELVIDLEELVKRRFGV